MRARRRLERLTWESATVDERPVTYGVAGTGPPLVFLHGWGLGCRTYDKALRQLVAQGRTVYAPALPGFAGTAELRDDEFTVGGYGRWVLSFMDAVGLDEPVTLVGHSFGGGVAIRATYEATARVGQLVLINSIGGSAWGRNGRVARTLAERPLWDWGLHFPRDVLPVRQITRVVPVLAEDAITNVVRNPRAVWQVANLARKASLTHELEVLKHRRMPIVILWGRGDRIVPEEAFRELCSAAGVGSAAAQAVTVEGSHSWLLSDPAGFGEVMTNIVAVAERAAELDEQSV